MNTETLNTINSLVENEFTVVCRCNAAFAEKDSVLIILWDEDDGSNEPTFGYCIFDNEKNIGKVDKLSFDSAYHCLAIGKHIGNHIKSVEDFDALVEKKLGV